MEGHVMKILLAIDGSPCSDAAIEEVARRPWPAGGEIKIVSAIEPPIMPGVEPWLVPPDYFEQIERAGHERANATVEGALTKLRGGADKTLKLTTATPTGAPKQVILDVAEAWGADLIVVGSHGYGAWDRFLLGSVSNAVATHAKCSVEIVRCPQAKTAEQQT
jgi:nucleotide-binding universal stress UspA family protein